MITHLIAGILGSAAGYLPVLLLGDHMSFGMSFVVSTVVGGVTYVYAYYKLKQWRGEI